MIREKSITLRSNLVIGEAVICGETGVEIL